MNLGFWGKLKKPIIALAPMADVTDAAFRRIIAKYSRMGTSGGGPDVLWTEFVSADGLIFSKGEGRDKLLKSFLYTESERPIVAQIFGANPETIERASLLVADLGFDGLDINMGCPDRTIEKQCAGAALMKNPKLAREILRSAKQGVARSSRTIPISVKTRIGYNKNELADFLPILLEEEVAVVTIHARTRNEMSKVEAHWECIREAVLIRDNLKSKTLIFGNGDVSDLSDAHKKARDYRADGVMLGRAIFGNPFLFDSERSNFLRSAELGFMDIEKRLRVALEHSELFEKLFFRIKNFSVMKKHYKAYINGFDGAKELRGKLMETKNSNEVRQVTEEYLGNIIQK